MSNQRMSVATIDSPEFIKIEKTVSNPLISKCEIKVLYVGENRNKSYITKEVATQMAQTLPGAPIVGYYVENKEDFGDHGDQVIIDGEGVKFKSLTKPYGFVAPDSRIWFQKFEDTDEYGNSVVREYLMTEGYLWTGQYEEARRVMESGNPQSMELDEKTLKGYWSTNINKGTEFFIINDAIFSKLCILGEDVEPCFEGASVTAPKVSSSFSMDKDFTQSLYNMMNELKFMLKDVNEGGLQMENLDNPIVEEEVVETEFEAVEVEEGESVQSVVEEIETTVEEYAKAEDDKEEEEATESEEAAAEPSEECPEKEDEEEKPKTKHELELEELQTEYSLLQEKYSSLEEKYNELVSFKASVEEKEKDALIDSFYMLDDEDKQDVIEHKAQYSLEDIESKLSVICFRKKVSFASEEETDVVEKEVATVFTATEEAENVPAYIAALKNTQKNRD